MWSPLASRKAGSPTHSFLGQSLLVASDMLCQEHAPELGKRIGLRVVESPKDGLPLWDRESEHPRLTLPCLLEPGGQIRFPGASKQASQLEDVGVRDRDAGELHAQRATRAEFRENAAWGSASSTFTRSTWRQDPPMIHEGEWAGRPAAPSSPPLEALPKGWSELHVDRVWARGQTFRLSARQGDAHAVLERAPS